VRNPIGESILPVVRSVPGVEAAAGSVEGYAQFVSHDGKAISSGSAATLGLSFDPDPRISELHIVEGKAPTTSHHVVMDAGTAHKYDFRVGQ
jgi:putative ABC transport system permease protein